MKKYYSISLLKFVAILSLLQFTGCAEDNLLKPLENSDVPPGQVSNVQVENKKGGAVLTYSLPDDIDLSYVMAEYTLPNGLRRTNKASVYTNTLAVDGFSVPGAYQVSLYAVNRSEVRSEPVSVEVNPEESPIWDIYRSMQIAPAFGGIQISASNTEKANVAILLMEQDEYGEWIADPNSIYTSAEEVVRTVRGMDTIPRDFAFTVRDRWLNYTDTLFATVTPLFEAPIPKSGYRLFTLPGDAPRNPNSRENGMWDGNIIDWPQVYQTRSAFAGPHMVTVDLGTTVKLSRLVIWDYPEYFNGRSYYYMGNLKEFEIYGSTDPNPDGQLDQSWILLGSYNATKPSGLPFGVQNDEDYRLANAGFSWEFPLDAPPVRYIRIRSIRNWGGTTYMGIAEIQAYGDMR